jgi:hypothetical protein
MLLLEIAIATSSSEGEVLSYFLPKDSTLTRRAVIK